MFNNPFSFEGRIRRTEYGLSLIIYTVCFSIISVIESAIASSSSSSSDTGAAGIAFLLLFLPAQFFIWAQGAKRCHDVGNSGWMQLIPFYPLVLIFQEGQKGQNLYGEDPKEPKPEPPESEGGYPTRGSYPPWGRNTEGGYPPGGYHGEKDTIKYDVSGLTISSATPCLIVFLLDQSGSMNDQFGNASHSKAVELASAINDNIYEIGIRCIDNNGEVMNRFEIAIIGYGKNGDKVQSGWEGQLSGEWVVPIKKVFNNSLREKDGKPIWIQPYSNGSTPMAKAFEDACNLCNDWINCENHRDCHPPIIINITDGEATDKSPSELKKVVNRIKALRTNYGNIFVLNIHISSQNGDRILYPNDISIINDIYAKLLFEMSTPLDENMIHRARQYGYNIQNNAKGYVFNGNATDLMNFLNIGTPR